MVFFALSTPIDSTTSLASLMPAVSKRCKTIPLRLISPSTTSLVVPAISVTMAFSSPTREFNNDDLPTFGLPTIATLTPSLMILAFSPSSINLLIMLRISSHIVITCCLLACSISSYSGKSIFTSIREIMSASLVLTGANKLLVLPVKEYIDISLASFVVALIMSLMDSACTKSIF